MQNAPREHSAILSTFIRLPFVVKTFVLSICEWQFSTGFTVDGSLYTVKTPLKLMWTTKIQIRVDSRRAYYGLCLEYICDDILRCTFAIYFVKPNVIMQLTIYLCNSCVQCWCLMISLQSEIVQKNIRIGDKLIQNFHYGSSISGFMGRNWPQICFKGPSKGLPPTMQMVNV